MRRTRSIFLGLAVAALAVPGTAFAQSGDRTNPGGVGGTGSGDGGTLPFTGLNLILIIMVGVGLVALGFLLRHRAHGKAS